MCTQECELRIEKTSEVIIIKLTAGMSCVYRRFSEESYVFKFENKNQFLQGVLIEIKVE